MARPSATLIAAVACALCHGVSALGSAAGRASMRTHARPLSSRAAVSCAAGTATLYQQDGDLAASRVSGSLAVKPGMVLSLDDGRDALVLYQRNEFSYVLLAPDGGVPTEAGGSDFCVTPLEVRPGLTLNWKGERIGGPSGATSGPKRKAFATTLSQKERASPRSGLLTGLTAIDALAPLGRGQSMLVIGPEDGTATELCLDLLLAQRGSGVRGIYVAMRPAEEMAALAESASCVTVSSSSVGEFAASVAAACTLAEIMRDAGEHVCVVVDDLQVLRSLWQFMQATELKMYSEEGLDLGGIEESTIRDDAAGSELRTFYSSVIERAGARSAATGGGSLTMLMIVRKPSMYPDAGTSAAFPVEAFEPVVYPKATLERVRLLAAGGVQLTSAVLAKLGISSPGSQGSSGMLAARKHIDECISLADGHLLLDERLVRAGVSPAIDVRASLSRIGLGKAVALRVTPMAAAIRQIAPRLRLELAVASDTPTIAGAVMTATEQRVFAWRAVLQQPLGRPRTLAQSVLALFCARAGYFDSLHAKSLDGASAKAYQLVDAMVAAAPAVVARLGPDYELSAADEAALHDAVASLQPAAA